MPDLFIIGAPKCGTTSLYEWLNGHPQVHMAAIKEPNYFAPDLFAAGPENVLRHPADHDRYLELFAGAGDARRLGEASVRYIYSKAAPALIREAQPGAYIVVALRNPVDMAYSLHSHKVARGSEVVADFERALSDEDRDAGRGRSDTNPLMPSLRDQARYGDHLARWFDTFGRDRIHVIIFEEMIREPEKVFRGLLEFLGVDSGYQPDSYRAYNVAHGGRGRLVRRLSRMRGPRWFVWDVLVRVMGEPRTRALSRRYRHSRLMRRNIDRQPMSDDARRRLEAEFEPDVARVSALIGRDLRALWFGRPETSGLAPSAPEAQPIE